MATIAVLDLTIAPDKREDLFALMRDIIADTRAFDGNQGITVAQNQDDANNIAFIETWDSRAHFERYFAWRQERGDVDNLGACFAAPPVVRVFDETGI